MRWAIGSAVFVTLALSTVADGRTYSIRPSAPCRHLCVFSLTALRGMERKLLSAELVTRHGRHPVRLSAARRAVTRGRIALRVHGRPTRRGKVRLLVRLDTRAPTPPGRLGVVASARTAAVTWTAARDNVRVAAYQVLRNGALLATVGGAARSYTDARLSP